MRVAFVHDWLTAHTGSERTLEAAASLFPEAPIFALVWDERALAHTSLPQHRVVPSFIQRLPGSRRHYQRYLPLMPLAVEQFDLRGYDVVISSSHCVAKGALTSAEQLHISYVHTPMRYAWDLYQDYLDAPRMRRRPGGLLARLVLHYLRQWDVAAANRVDRFVANSQYVAQRIAKTYRREARVIHPPVDVERFRADRPREDFYVAAGRLVPYKRTQQIVEAFNALGRKLVIIGDGPERAALQRLAKANVSFLGQQPDEVLADHLSRCRGLVFAGQEDFGIVPVEAQAAGAPVVALRRGGVRETVVDGRTGLLYDEPTPAALAAAVRELERRQEGGAGSTAQSSAPGEGLADAAAIRAHAERFGRTRFERELERFVADCWGRFPERSHEYQP